MNNEQLKSKIGETNTMTCGMKATVINYRNYKDIDVQFEDGTIATNKQYGHFKNGNIKYCDNETNNIENSNTKDQDVKQVSDSISEKLMLVNIDKKKSVQMNMEELFDASKFKSAKFVSFVSTPELFYNIVKDYEDAEIIIGIEDSEYRNSFATNLMKNIYAFGIEFFEKCPDEMKTKISEDKIRIRFSKTGVVFHNKIYLLEGETNRIISGSSNLTYNGFGLGRMQYEDLIISDNTNIYNIYLSRYNILRENSIDYIPEECKKLWRDERRLPDYNEKNTVMINHLNTNRDNLEAATEDISTLKKLAKEEQTPEAIFANRTIEIINQVTTNAKNKKRKIKSPEELSSPTIRVTRVGNRIENDDDKAFKRSELIYREETNQLYYCKPGFTDDKSMLFNGMLNATEIKERISLIDNLVNIYKTHSVDEKIENSKKAYEILLHAFMSPFMWKVRKDYINMHSTSNNSIGGDIPNILVINGTAECGKSAMIAALNKMLQNESFEIPQWKEYLKIDKYALDRTVRENNIYPLIIDEIEKDFISGGNCTYKGEAWIKSIANSLGGTEHPYIITATNKSIDLSAPLRRRVNYISFGSKIDRVMQSDARDKFSKIINAADTRLFEDFCNRVLLKIEKSNSLYDSTKIKNGIKDPIAVARDIFMEYYAIAGLPIPEYFPTEPFDDYSTTGKQMWKDTVCDPNCKDAFIFQENNNELIVNTEKLSSKMYDKKSEKLIAYLNEYVKSRGNVAESTYIHLDATKFFNWIEISNPFKRKGILKKLFNKA